MITRNIIGDNFSTLVDYLHYGRPDAPVDKQPLVLLAEGVRTDSSQAMGDDFAWGSTLNTSLTKPVWHTVISFNPDDTAKLTNEKMLAVAQDFRKELGLLNTQCVIIRHFDQEDNQHLHILVNRVADDGHSIPDVRNFYRSKVAVEPLCERHGLTPWAGQRPELQHPERIVGAYDKAGAEIRQALAYGLQTATERATLWEELKGKGIATNESSRGVTFTKDGFTFKGSQVARQYSLGGIDEQLAANRLVQVQQAEARAAEARENEQLRRRGQQVLAELVDQKTFANRTELTGQVLAHGYIFVSSLEREMQLRHEASGREFALVDVQPGGPTAPSFWTQADAVIQARAAEAAAQAERRELARQETTQVLTQTRDSGLRQPEEFFDCLRAQPVDLVQDAQTQEITHVIHRQSKEKFAWAEVQPGGVGAPPLAEQLAAAVQAEAQRAANQRREEDRVQVEREIPRQATTDFEQVLAAADQRDKSSTLARPVVPIVVPEGTTSSGPLVVAAQPAAGVSGTGAPVPTTAEGPVSSPPVGAEATSSVMLSAAVRSTARPEEQTTVAAGSSTVNQPAHAADAPSPTVPALGSPAEAASAPATSATAETALERTLARWEAQKLADAEDERLAVLYYAWLQLEKEVKQQVTAATHEALATGVAFSTLLDRKGLELLPATNDVPICVRHRVSGESFSAEEVPLPSLLLTTASQASAQYGVVQMADTDLRTAPECLAEVRAHLLEVGLTVGLVEPATARQPAQLTWAFDPQQADLALVMAKLDAVQAARNALVLEAPHAWQSGSGKVCGLAEPQLYWEDRAGQFNQARVELDTIDQRSAGRVDRVRQALSEQRVALGPVQTDAQGRLSFELRYHTLAPTIDAIDTVLIQVRYAGFALRESEQQQQARAKGIPVVAKRDAGKEYSR